MTDLTNDQRLSALEETMRVVTRAARDLQQQAQEADAFHIVGRFMLRDIVKAQPDPTAYFSSLSDRILSQLPATDADGTPFPVYGQIKELLSILDPQRGKS